MITLKTLTWSNCFSYGDNNILNLDNDILVQLIGENGAGKSSIPIILEEALFNKNSKGVKKTDIINRNNPKKGYKIGLTFEVDNKEYTISINRKSSLQVVLECDGEDISSHTATNTFKTIEKVLGIDFKTFSQLVYQSTTSSLQFLTATDTNRKKFLIELLNLDNYLKLFDNFKTAHKSASAEVSEIKGSIDTLEKWIETNKPKSTTKRTFKDIPKIDEELIKEQGQIETKLSNLASINSKINKNNQYRDMLAKISPTDLVAKVERPELAPPLHEKLGTLQAAIASAESIKTQLSRLSGTCPTCQQEVDEDFTNSLVSEQEKVIEKSNEELIDVNSRLSEIKLKGRVYKEHEKLVAEFEKLSSLYDKELPEETEDQSELNTRLAELKNIISDQNAAVIDANSYNAEVTKFNTELDYLIEQVKEFKEKLEQKEKDLKEINETYANLEVLKKAFSTNGLVAYKIENLVKDLEDLVNEYLAELSDGRFGLIFEVSNDKLNVVISDNGNDIGILALSSGELARVNTATLLAIRKLMSTLSKSRINVLFLDEVINVLDTDGRERLIEVLLRENELNTFLVSHGYSHPLLTKINIVKEKDISRLE